MQCASLVFLSDVKEKEGQTQAYTNSDELLQYMFNIKHVYLMKVPNKLKI